jgi:hypothetical protein
MSSGTRQAMVSWMSCLLSITINYKFLKSSGGSLLSLAQCLYDNYIDVV